MAASVQVIVIARNSEPFAGKVRMRQDSAAPFAGALLETGFAQLAI